MNDRRLLSASTKESRPLDELRGLPDESCLAQILRDEIDILVDLAETPRRRLALLGAKAAPIKQHTLVITALPAFWWITGSPILYYTLTIEMLRILHREALEAESLLCELQALPNAPAVQPRPVNVRDT